MDSIAYTNNTETKRMPRVKRERRVPVANQLEISKTPESELLTVEEYFDKVWNRYLEKVVTVREQLQ